MPLFFLLSGFCLTLGYGKKKYTKSISCCGRRNPGTVFPEQGSQNPDEFFETKEFLFGRITRIVPVYYFCYLVALPLLPLGHSYFPPTMYEYSVLGSILSLFFVQTWIMIYGFGADGPSWTVSTLFFFYLTFPR